MMDVLDDLGSTTGTRGLPASLGAWQVAILVLLANYTYSFSRTVTFRTEFLVIPFAIWLAHRYGRHGFRIFALGGIVLWLQYRFGVQRFALSPDIYLIALLAALAVAYPQRWVTLLERARASSGTSFLLFGLIPIQITFAFDALTIGWVPDVFLAFCFFLLGYSGAAIKRLLGLLALFSLVGYVLATQHLYVKDSGFHVFYTIIGVKGMLVYSLWLLGGALLYEVKSFSHRDPQRSVIWCRRPYTIYLVGLIMMLAPISIGLRLWDIAMPLWGSKWLLVFGAFLAGVLWKQKGIQLTFAAIGGTSVLTMLVIPELSDYLVIKSPDFEFFIEHTGRSFPQEALFALLYVIIGYRASSFMLGPQGKDQLRP